MQWLDAVLQGVLLGGLYAQYALGMTLMFGVMRVVNAAHGDIMVLLGLCGIALTAWLGIGPYAAMAMLTPIAVLLGYALQRVVLNRVIGDDPLPSLIATFGLSTAIQNLLLEVFSADARSLNAGGLESASVGIGELHLGVLPLQIFGAAVVLTTGLDLVLKRSRFGRALRASAADAEAASITGIDPKRIYAGATAIATGLLALAGVFQATRATLSPADGPAQLIYAFEAVIIGGMGSVWGAFIGAIVLGVSQVVGSRIDAGWGSLVGHLVFIGILCLRPEGLMARQR